MWPSSVAEHASLCLSCRKSLKTGYLATWLILGSGMILQVDSTIFLKVSIELLVTPRVPQDMTERTLKEITHTVTHTHQIQPNLCISLRSVLWKRNHDTCSDFHSGDTKCILLFSLSALYGTLVLLNIGVAL